MATIKDVAAYAGVSVATVSYYLNNTKPVSRATSAKISEAIQALQYSQNLSAKALKSSVYKDIGVILPNLSDSYYVQLYQGIESVLNNSAYYLNLNYSYDIPELEHKAAEELLSKRVSGLIVVTSQPDNWKYYYEHFTGKNCSLVLIDRRIEHLDANLVCFDNRQVMEKITHQLLDSGYENLFLLAGPELYSSEAACISGFCAAFSPERQPEAAERVISIELNKEDAFRKTIGILSRMRPDAILATSELTATGILEALYLLGYTQEQIPVITMGEEHWNKFTLTGATFSVPRPAIRMGMKAAELLIGKMQSPELRENEEVVFHVNEEDTLQKLRARLPRKPVLPPPSEQQTEKIRVLMLDTPAVHAFCRLLKNFENRTGIRAEVEFRPHHRMLEEIRRSHETGTLSKNYDVYMYDIPWLPDLAATGLLQELTPGLRELDTDVFLPGAMDRYGLYEGQYYGIPLIYAPQMLYYRKNLFEDYALRTKFEKLYNAPLKPPLTFMEFNTIANFFTTETDQIPYGISIPAAYPECLAPELYMRLRAYGSEVVNSRGKVVINNPESLRAYINLLRALKCAKPDYMQATDVTVTDDFLRGDTAMLITYPGFLTDASDLRKNSRIGSIGCTQIPGRSPLLGGWGLGISSRSQSFDQAFAFLKWACNEEMGNYFSMLGGYSAVTTAYTNDELVNLYPWLPLYKASYSHTKPMLPVVSTRGKMVSSSDIDDIVCKWLYRQIREDLGIETVLRNTQIELESLLEDL